jgi:hypothetical protein
MAVCLQPGPEPVLDAPVRFGGCSVFCCKAPREGRRTERFRQVNEDSAILHHDALEFANGKTVLLNTLRRGRFTTVIQLPVACDQLWLKAERSLNSSARAG